MQSGRLRQGGLNELLCLSLIATDLQLRSTLFYGPHNVAITLIFEKFKQ